MQALWMILASLFFACMAVCIKWASQDFNTAELVAYRGAIGVVLMLAVCRWRGIALRTPVPEMHVWRGLVGTFSLAAWFYAIAHLPLATAMTLNYMSGVWVAAALLAATLLQGSREELKHQGPLALTVLLSFVGVLLVLRPAATQEQQLFAGVIGLLSGMGAAMAYLQVAALGRVGEPEIRTVFYFSIAATVCGLIGMTLQGTSAWPGWRGLWLLPIGILAALGQLCMTRAYASGSTLLAANLQYSGIVFSALFGLLLFQDLIPALGWLGILTIVLSGMMTTHLRQKRMPRSPAEEHS
jgi:S-adenosylmethionine uptake transporter